MKKSAVLASVAGVLLTGCSCVEADKCDAAPVQATVDFSKSIAEIKPLHGVNNSPVKLSQKNIPAFQEAGIPFCRLHDTAGAWGGTHYVDVPNIFPDFDADPADPASYDFAFTDAYLKTLHGSGTEIFFRLGVTIENNYRIKAYNIYPPKDFNKWAEICAGIVRHYNEGWANGFHFNIRYWEVWNEPENPPMWQGTKAQFFELYRITANRLKKEFPQIKVGGYASCGFYAINRPDPTPFYQSFVTWFDEFLDYVKAPETAAPLDFYSWHLYTTDPDEIKLHSDYVAKKLREKGFTNTENIFNEWNYVDKDPAPEVRWVRMKNHYGASFVAAAFAVLQNSDTDKAMYYDALPTRAYCGLYEFPSMLTTATFDVFKYFNVLYKLGKQNPAAVSDDKVKILAASDGKEAAVMLANHTGEAKIVTLDSGDVKFSSCLITDANRRSENIAFDGKILLPPYSLAFLFTDGAQTAEGEKAEVQVNKNHAGLDGGN